MHNLSSHPIEIEVLAEDEGVIILNKPPGVHSAMLPADLEALTRGLSVASSVAAWLYQTRHECRTASPKGEDCGLVHRLDYETSGALVAAKSGEIWSSLSRSLHDGAWSKSYLAVLDGCLSQETSVEGWIGSRERRDNRVVVAPMQEHPRMLHGEAVFTPLALNTEARATLARVRTGAARRHQVRALALAAGYPLLGDSTYESHRALIELARGQLEYPTSFFLHAETVKLLLPGRGETTFTAPIPAILKVWFPSTKF